MGWLLKALLFLMGVLKLLKTPTEDEKAKAAHRKEKEAWEAELARLDKVYGQAEYVDIQAVLCGNSNYMQLHDAWMQCAKQRRNHMAIGERKGFVS